MFFLENSTSNFNFHTEEMMPENNKRNTKMVTGEEIGGGGKMIVSLLDALFVLLRCFVWFL